jgi:UPF0176 protein
MESSSEKYIVILFYKYIPLNGEDAVLEQQKFCEGTELKGRVLIGDEGINGTLAGSRDDVDKYIGRMLADPKYSDIDFKESESDFMPFPKLKIKCRKEVVTLNLEEDIDMQTATRGKYLLPDEMYELLKSNEEYYIVDARNNYETKIGKFKDAIVPDIENFREFPDFLKNLVDLKKKKVIFYCTGGIRCEKATAYAIKQGFENVYQLHGGIQRYAEKYPKLGFEGSMYVFDNRIGISFDKSPDRVILTNCEYCNISCDDYKNCFNSQCNKRIIICDECYKTNEGCCSDECRQIKHPRKVEFRFKDKL